MQTVSDIMIRAYYHALNRNQVNHFKQFISIFVSPAMDRLPEDLVSWLSNEFGIKYEPNSSLGINIDNSEVQRISSRLSSYKLGDPRASKLRSTADAQVISTIFAVRERNNEISTSGISGYKTWWLTSDVTTQIAAAEVSGNKYSISCYMRPDFLYNYISLAPTKGQIDDAFTHFFPTLLGVNLSTFLPENVSQVIHNYVKEHKEQSESRKISIINELIDDLKQNPRHQNVQYVKNKTKNPQPYHKKKLRF